jgi:hypothetical protein
VEECMRNRFISNEYLYYKQLDRRKCALDDKCDDEIGFLGIVYQISRWYKINKRTRKYD